jgi:hypothetical protein
VEVTDLHIRFEEGGEEEGAAALDGESERLAVESPWSQFTSECQRC